MKIFSIEITEEVKEILKQGKIEGNLYFLPVIQLDRKQYTDVNQVLELLGGKWNRSKKAHIFESSEKAQSLIEALESGSVVDKKKTYQFFETPESVVKIMIDLADIKTGMDVLEPSAGHGAILDHLPKDIELHIIEVDEEKCQVLKNKGYKQTKCGDFLSFTPQFAWIDRIVMNPPFTGSQDVDHVLHAYSLLSNIGILVSVMPSGIEFKNQKKYKQLRDLITEHGYIKKLPEGSFSDSGTEVNTVLVVLTK